MSFDVVKTELNLMYANDPAEGTPRVRLNDEELERWARLTDTTKELLCDRIGIYLAHGFHNSRLSFYFCDGIVNDLFGLITSCQVGWPDIFWRVYLTFDEGEYHHRNDGEQDPVELYTKPRIAEIGAAYPHVV